MKCHDRDKGYILSESKANAEGDPIDGEKRLGGGQHRVCRPGLQRMQDLFLWAIISPPGSIGQKA
jgi:hypothetical protein